MVSATAAAVLSIVALAPPSHAGQQQSVETFAGRSHGCAGTGLVPIVNESNAFTSPVIAFHGCRERPPGITGAAATSHRWSPEGEVAVDVSAERGSQIASAVANATATVVATVDIPVTSARIEVRAPYEVIDVSRTPGVFAARVPFPASVWVYPEHDQATAYGGVRAGGPSCADGSPVASSRSLFFNDLTPPTKGEFTTELYCPGGARITSGRAWVQLYVHAEARSANGTAQHAQASAQLVRVTFRTFR
ncbi:MAG: hypothetical protein KY469_02925 [Actinobacteria bacterium]|nr:hypothetical protein [Actinomycetota bacterium]